MKLYRFTISLLILLTAIDISAQQVTTIADAKKLEFGSVIGRVAGRVTAGGVFRNIAYMEDGTAGIAIFNQAFNAAVKIGDSVVVDSGELVEFGQSTGAPGTGLSELVGSRLRFTVIPVERNDPRPRTTTIPLVGEGVEGSLIRIRNVKFVEKGVFQGETNYNVMDRQGGDIQVRIDGATDIAVNSLSIPENEIDLVGVVSQFRGAYQILPRNSDDLSLPPIEEDTVSPERTLDVTTWNLDWYGSADTSRGPNDKLRQRRSIRQVMDSVGADLYALQEVFSQEALSSLSDSIEGSYGNTFASDVTSDQKMAYIYNTQTVTPVTTGLAVNGGSQAWAGGRFPYRMTFDATINGTTKRLVVFTIHAKATAEGSEVEDYGRRQTDAQTFHAYLQDFYADSSLIFLGDFNDILTASVVDPSFTTPWASFVDDEARWFTPTLPLEERGLASFIGFSRSFLDHIFVTTDIKDNLHRTYLEAPQAYLSSFSSTVSDHLPVTMRMFLTPTTSVEDHTSSQSVRIVPNPAHDRATVEVIAESARRITIDIVDPLGNVIPVANEVVDAGTARVVSLPVSQLANGMYYVRVVNGGDTTTATLVIQR